MIKVYIASKLHYASQFRGYRKSWALDGINLHARWFDQAELETNGSLTPDEFRIFWAVDEEDVKEADALILYAAPSDKLRGALVEAGMAIAWGKLVIVIGDHSDYATWQYHHHVVGATSFEHAKTLILRRFRQKDLR